MNDIVIKPLEIMELLVKYGPYFGIYFLTQAIKSAFKINGRWVLLMVFIVGLIVAFAQMTIENVMCPLQLYLAWLLIRGMSLSGVSWLAWCFVKLILKRR